LHSLVRGVVVGHSSISRWAIRFLPLLEKVFRKHKHVVSTIWEMDETSIKVNGAWKYLYRAVDKQGQTVNFLLAAKPNAAATKRYFDHDSAGQIDQQHCRAASAPPSNVSRGRCLALNRFEWRAILTGIELMHMIRKVQFVLKVEGISFVDQFYALVAQFRLA